MTQSQRGPSRAEVSDLRNIVDRLDLLMGSPGQPHGRVPRDDAVAALGERIQTLEAEVEELRTLVNHLMTIATWQAKVTATLVDDREAATAGEDPAAGPRHVAPAVRDAGPPADEERDDTPPAPSRPTGHAVTLDDDIDDILGTDRTTPRHHDTAPPDFGI